jgi:hypothetical protein
MPTYVRQASHSIVLMKVGSSNRAADDVHLTIGRGSGSRSTYVGRVELRFPEPDWPTRGTLRVATLTVQPSGTDQHPQWEGGSPRIEVKRMGERARFGSPADGHGSDDYSTEGQGDKYPGTGAVGDPVEFNVNGTTSRDVTSMVRQMLPTRLGGGGQTYGYFRIISVDEDNANRSVVLSQKVTLSVEIDTRVVPSVPTILEVVGEVDGTSAPALVATDDGRTLEVRFGFAAGPRETCLTAELELRTPGSEDGPPATGTVLYTSGDVAPIVDGSGTGIYRQRITGIAQGTEGAWRLRTRSSTGKQGPWTELDDGHVQLATIPGAPVDIVISPFTESPTIEASLPSSHPGTISHMEALVTLLPQGTTTTVEEDIGGSVRRATLTYPGDLGDGQRTSTRIRFTDEDGIVGRYSGPVEQTHHVAPTVTVSPAPGRLLTRTPTITLGFPLADGAKIELLHETDDLVTIYASGATPLTNQTSHPFVIPADTLTWGQRFRVRGAYVPDGGGVTYTDFSEPVGPYSVAGLPTAVLSVPDAIGHNVPVEDIEWEVIVTDPDGAATARLDIELREADTPQGSGALHRRWYELPTNPFTIPDGEVIFETSVDARVRAGNDASALASTTLNGALIAGATTLALTSATNFAIGQDIRIASAVTNESEVRRIANLVGTTVTLDEALAYAHASGQTVTAWVWGPWSPWTTWTALESPEVDLLTPADSATVTRAWQAFDWSSAANGSRTIVDSTLNLYDEDEQLVGTVVVTGTTSIANAPAFLLEDATVYQWDVTVTDSEGLSTTSDRRTFTTAFTEPEAMASVTAETIDGSVVLSWDEVTDTDLHHVEVSWQADDGTWVRIDGGPEELDDGLEAFTGTTLTHIGARLGDNAYAVRPHNGWRAAEPANATVTLGWYNLSRGSWELVGEDGDITSVGPSDASITMAAMLSTSQPPGGLNQAIHHGIAARSIPMRVTYLPSEDGLLATTLRRMMADPIYGRPARPQWIRPAGGYAIDPVWCVLASMTTSPAQHGFIDQSLDWLEVGPPIHSILPPAAEEPPESTPDIYSDVAEIIFDEVELP